MTQVKQESILEMIFNSDLRTLGGVATEAVTALNKQCGANEIESIVLKDAALTAEVIKIASTLKTDSDTQRKSLHEAIIRIGHDGLRSVFICIGIVENIPSRNGAQRAMVLDCLHRCFETATHADNLAKKLTGGDNNSDAYIAGLLCNIGELAFFCSPIVNLKDYTDLTREGLTPEQACLSLCGFDYDELCEQIVEKWQLSPLINDAFKENPATDKGRAVKAAFELTRAFHNGRNSKAFIQVSKRLVREFKLGFKESVAFIEKGVEHAKAEFNQYKPLIQKDTAFIQKSPLEPDGNNIDQLAAKQQTIRPLDRDGQENVLNKFLELAKKRYSLRIYCTVLSDALYNYVSFERVVISDLTSNNELTAIAVSGTDTQNLKKNFSFIFNPEKSVIREIIEKKKILYFSKASEPKSYDLVDDNIKNIAGTGRAFCLSPIIQNSKVIAIAYMDMGAKQLPIAKEQIKATNILINSVSSALSTRY